jgi:hypothetical protein
MEVLRRPSATVPASLATLVTCLQALAAVITDNGYGVKDQPSVSRRVQTVFFSTVSIPGLKPAQKEEVSQSTASWLQ